MGYQAVRGKRWKLTHYTELSGMDELYDLQTDPFEMRNVIDDPKSKDALTAIRARLMTLLKQTQTP